MTGALVLNGEYFCGLIEGDLVVCCDGGYDKSDRCDVLVGDMDSIHTYVGEEIDGSGSEKSRNVSVIELDTDKDMTDGEAGLDYLIENGYNEILIYGLAGGRLDHILSNIGLMAKALDKGVHKITAKCNDFDGYMINSRLEIGVKINSVISISPFSDAAHIIHTEGLKYGIDNKTLFKNSSLSYSNVAISDKISVTMDSGKCFVIVNK